VALGAITDEGKGVVLELFQELLTGPVRAFENFLLVASEVDGLDTSGLLCHGKGRS